MFRLTIGEKHNVMVLYCIVFFNYKKKPRSVKIKNAIFTSVECIRDLKTAAIFYIMNEYL